MIWSIMPEEMIFAAEEKPADTLACSYAGRQMLVRPCGGGWGEIISLLSTDPADFLDARFQAGLRIPVK